jgi:NADH dehydrogenase FAD-containing subunit
MRVVVVGGGFCGSTVAKKLERNKDLEVTLIDKKGYFEYTPSIAKLLFYPEFTKKLTKPFSYFLKHTNVVTDSLVKVKKDHVITTKGTYPFDYLILCLGIDYPIHLENKHNVATIKSGAELKEISTAVKNAKQILIIGGGLIGCELAGEFATRTPEKEITLVHLFDRLLERNKPSVSAYAKKFLEKRKIKILLNEKIVNHSDSIFLTDKKRKIQADIAFWCGGISYNPYYIKGFDESIFTKQKALIVNQYLQLKDHPNIFVGGDLTSINEEKNAVHAKSHSHVIVKNINCIMKNKPLRAYYSHVEAVDISLGCWYGIFILPPVYLYGFIPGVIKHLIEKYTMWRL